VKLDFYAYFGFNGKWSLRTETVDVITISKHYLIHVELWLYVYFGWTCIRYQRGLFTCGMCALLTTIYHAPD